MPQTPTLARTCWADCGVHATCDRVGTPPPMTSCACATRCCRAPTCAVCRTWSSSCRARPTCPQTPARAWCPCCRLARHACMPQQLLVSSTSRAGGASAARLAVRQLCSMVFVQGWSVRLLVAGWLGSWHGVRGCQPGGHGLAAVGVQMSSVCALGRT